MSQSKKNTKLRVLFLCLANSCRSQMAEGIVRHFAGEKFIAESAGYMATYVHPDAIIVMKEIGIDISSQRSKGVSELYGRDFDIVITVCSENDVLCPVWYGPGERVNISFPDPVMIKGDRETVLKGFRAVRDAIKREILNYLNGYTE
jgi:arsenate reductase (thioredoxin)